MLGALQDRCADLRQYAGVYLRATQATDRRFHGALMAPRVVWVSGDDPTGLGRYAVLEAALADGHTSFLSCDFDRWLHWAGRYPAELTHIPSRAERGEPPPWYVCLGRTPRAFATHPLVQQHAEQATNHAFSLAVGRRVDATAGAAWLSAEGARIVLEGSTEATAATDLEWPALVCHHAPDRLAAMAVEGLEFETAEFFAAEIGAAGGEEAWLDSEYEQPSVWQARLELAARSIAAACQVLGHDSAQPLYHRTSDMLRGHG